MVAVLSVLANKLEMPIAHWQSLDAKGVDACEHLAVFKIQIRNRTGPCLIAMNLGLSSDHPKADVARQAHLSCGR